MIAVFLAIQGIAIIIIAFADSVPLAYLFALLYGIGFGGRNPLTTAIRGEYFG
ncbi:MAG TPA: MFS transporter, partial [Dehalococcoidia bacterium]|nr:MFS transporter [Dehalococcoidia bacterium]